MAIASLSIGFLGCAALPRNAAQTADCAQSDQMCRLGIAAAQSGRLHEAEGYFRGATEESPQHAESWRRLAEVLRNRGAHDEAISAIESACHSAPRDAEPALIAGELQLDRGNAERAVQWADHAIGLDAVSARAWKLRGAAHARLGKTDRAMADLLQASRLAPQDTEVLLELARVHHTSGNHHGCLTVLHHLLECGPTERQSTEAQAMAGDSYLALGRHQSAAQSYRVASNQANTPVENGSAPTGVGTMMR